jgi:ABC-2 type transport system ATP-binding protein
MDEITRSHKRLIGADATPAAVAMVPNVIEASFTARQTTLIVRASTESAFDPIWEVNDVALEDIVLAYMAQSRAPLSESEAPQ